MTRFGKSFIWGFLVSLYMIPFQASATSVYFPDTDIVWKEGEYATTRQLRYMSRSILPPLVKVMLDEMNLKDRNHHTNSPLPQNGWSHIDLLQVSIYETYGPNMISLLSPQQSWAYHGHDTRFAFSSCQNIQNLARWIKGSNAYLDSVVQEGSRFQDHANDQKKIPFKIKGALSYTDVLIHNPSLPDYDPWKKFLQNFISRLRDQAALALEHDLNAWLILSEKQTFVSMEEFLSHLSLVKLLHNVPCQPLFSPRGWNPSQRDALDQTKIILPRQGENDTIRYIFERFFQHMMDEVMELRRFGKTLELKNPQDLPKIVTHKEQEIKDTLRRDLKQYRTSLPSTLCPRYTCFKNSLSWFVQYAEEMFEKSIIPALGPAWYQKKQPDHLYVHVHTTYLPSKEGLMDLQGSIENGALASLLRHIQKHKPNLPCSVLISFSQPQRLCDEGYTSYQRAYGFGIPLWNSPEKNALRHFLLVDRRS